MTDKIMFIAYMQPKGNIYYTYTQLRLLHTVPTYILFYAATHYRDIVAPRLNKSITRKWKPPPSNSINSRRIFYCTQ